MAKVAKPSQVKKTSVGLIGAGSMGGALLRGWLEGGIIDAARSAIFDPAVPDQNRMTAQTAGMAINPGKDLAVDVLVVAVKPQISASILPDFAESAAAACVLSVMAGKTIAAISGELGGAPRVARAMPNLPSSIGKGASGLYAPPAIDADMRKRLATLLAASGVVVSVESEEAIDVVTAISGSGPAYFFLFTQALEKAGVALGLAPADAALLARATATGAGALLEARSEAAAALKKAVTSPGGTTAAALDILEGDKNRLEVLVKEAAAAAARRAEELRRS